MTVSTSTHRYRFDGSSEYDDLGAEVHPLLGSSSISGPSSSSLSHYRVRTMGKTKTQGRRSFRSLIWDTWDKPPEERKFLAKLDACLLTYAALSYFSK
ncbi:hypothetical protein QCA50_014352 [Cerrena zonata]|uniref:Uncharacterized protein n=1 Tax=Cerrena zonata TaxID=2478898 RepID=A0AAW0FR52_9APHY